MSFVTEVLFSVDVSRFVLFLFLSNSFCLFTCNLYLKVRELFFSKASLSCSLEMVQVRLSLLLYKDHQLASDAALCVTLL